MAFSFALVRENRQGWRLNYIYKNVGLYCISILVTLEGNQKLGGMYASFICYFR
ncbi:hypothetical protein ACI8B_40029 [Acinetobacter proteolyticus]|uniref:Uncharacterized protein n=1 Tax=Acinetobacter proteolyticus TaxID=1776741 RepID=A0A653KA87_9GAMM|nr:hypothetical protein ACI8B_40029 [Acinetobacter proteolyticus]